MVSLPSIRESTDYLIDPRLLEGSVIGKDNVSDSVHYFNNSIS